MTDIYTLIKIFEYFKTIFDHRQKRQVMVVFAVILVGSAFELLGVSVIMPFVQAILDPDALMNDPIMKVILKPWENRGPQAMLVVIGIGIILIYLLKNIYLSFSGYVQSEFNNRIQYELSVKMLHSYISRPYLFFMNADTGEILRGLNEDIEGVYQFLYYFSLFISEASVSVFVFLYLLKQDALLAIEITAILLLCAFLVTVFVKKTISRLSQITVASQTRRSGIAVQIISNIKDIIVFDKKELFETTYKMEYWKGAQARIKTSFLGRMPERIIESFCITGIMIFIILRIAGGGNMIVLVPKLSVFIMGAFRILPAISRMTGYIQTFIANRPHVEAVYLNIKEAELYAESISDSKKLGSGDDKFETINMKDICFEYDGKKRQVVKHLNLEIRRGEKVGIIGESGSGKSTIGELLLALLNPQSGNIYIDDINIEKVPLVWRSTISYVPQMLSLFSGTIRFNITFTNDKDCDSEVWSLLEKVALFDFVSELPDGLDTDVGERGIRLSGGQRQRIAIARALYAEPQILLLDEATSALDNETEKEVMKAIYSLAKGITLIIIAHRTSTLCGCDHIYRMCDGALCEVKKEEL